MGALALGHVQEVGDDLVAGQDVGKPIFRPEQAASVSRLVTRNEREQRRSVFCALLKRRGTMAVVARAWGVSDAQVRRVRDGLAPLTDERIAALPAGLRAAVEARLAGPVQLRLPNLLPNRYPMSKTVTAILGWAGERKGDARRHVNKHTAAAENAAAHGDLDAAKAELDIARVWAGRESAFAEVVRKLTPGAKAERAVVT